MTFTKVKPCRMTDEGDEGRMRCMGRLELVGAASEEALKVA